MIEVAEYNLPDIKIIESEREFDFHFWTPDRFCIVLGRSDSPDTALEVENVLNDGISVLKRPSGGHTVVLSGKMVVFSIKADFKKAGNPKRFFRLVNMRLIEAFIERGVTNIHSRGISDLSIEDRKILGSSMYLKNNSIFYHAVLNINEEVSSISKYLKHPTSEPDYRKGRPHEDFVTSLQKEGYQISENEVYSAIKEAISRIREDIYQS